MKWAVTLACGLVASQAAFAEDAKPSEDSVKQLFDIMQSSRLIDTYMAQIETTVRLSMQQAMAGQPVSPQQQKIMDDLSGKIVALTKEEMNWPNIEPMMAGIYRDTFTQHEVDGMLAFYRSEAGKAVITKLPGAMQRTMEGMQSHVKTLTPKIVQLEKDSAVQLKAAAASQEPSTGSPAPSPPPPKQP